ncbi:hypothetical protein [uncultured Roseobacter sp.]|uniref:hypothetical protein n=1 Tax=uncultured Roseobacter sp. TaxID=114847 RepID=UPI002620A052|nr:hypothetical protein [uncultured Roseobacter sp.]
MLDTIKGNEHQTRPRLAVCSKESLVQEPFGVGGSSNWDTLPCQSLEEIIRLIKAGCLDAVALPFDPLDFNSRQNFLRLAENQRRGRPFLVSYSTFNPSWIENLVLSVGSNLHIRGNPKIQEIIKKLESHFRYVIAIH